MADPAVELLVELAHPFVPDVLARDGNESLTRVQLREIIRVNNLPGVRNERIGSVLHRLWSEESTNTNARSPQ
ncbi:hypothetical protein ACFYVL_09105 [Streptomyces sp. NPDC004111]|uniref:hypothetical protein n=1 Tax=Streptomyces sp. NPDC004111 TaxID=3364690 RepID=UPI0036C820AA